MSSAMENACISAAERYIQELGWVLVPVRGPGTRRPKAPIYDGWPECRPTWNDLAMLLNERPNAGIAINLGASELIDVEADTPEDEARLDDLCADLAFPCWRSLRSKHRLFTNDGSIEYLKVGAIEFRTGHHISILPPSLHALGKIRYEWITSPFDVSPPPLPASLFEFYLALTKKSPTQAQMPKRAPRTMPFPYRDDLDYVLRHFNLLEKAEVAGVQFLFKQADANGNIPCYVPDALRDNNPDEFPSGEFNVRNGVLRDFATGKNHRFFNLIGALTNRTWLEVFDEFKKVTVTSGRPHSRRICLPPPQTDDERIPLEEARAQLKDYLHANLSRDPLPKTLHLIEGPPGIGKTYGMCEELASLGKSAILLTLENRLAQVHRNLINQRNGRAEKMPVLRELGCIHPDEYEQMSRLGYQPSRSQPCRSCSIGSPQCNYLRAFADLEKNLQLCCPAIYHTHKDFYTSHGNDRRPVVVFDENCIDLILAPESHDLAAWTAWGRLLDSRNDASDTKMRRHVRRLRNLVRWLQVTARDFLKEDKRTKPVLIPSEFKHFVVRHSFRLQRWLDEVAGTKANRHIPNLYGAAVYLLSEPGSYVLFERYKGRYENNVRVRFRQWHRLPEDREVFILDATANEEIIRAVAPDWDVRVWKCPPVEQKGRVIQIMDFDTSRNFIKKEVARYRSQSPSWLAQVLDAIVAKTEKAAFISFKAVATDRKPDVDVLRQIAHSDKFNQRHHFPCRGIEIKSDLLVVLGTPYKNETAILEFALAIYGFDGLPKGDYQWQPRQEECFVTGNMGYGDARFRAIEQFVISADLAQAIGRPRPLQNYVTVYVITNAPIFGWEMTKFLAAELFDMQKPLRRDAGDKYQQYANEVIRRLDDHKWVSNLEICKSVGINPRTGRNYMVRFKKQHETRLDVAGKRITWKKNEAPTASSTSV